MHYGEIVQLGRHRLMCGDATCREDVMKLVDGECVNLVLTDPPYGMMVQSNDGTIGGGKIERNKFLCTPKNATSYPLLIGDKSSASAREHYGIISSLTDKVIMWGGQYFADFLPVNGGWLFWDKDNGGNDFSDGELAYCSRGKKIRKYKQMWNGAIREGNRTLNPHNRLHPTQKPVELHARILEDFTQPDDVVLDCFGGSGTTLIACEITGRKCLMMEISPDYCDIIANRFNSLHSITPLFSKEKAQCQA